MQHSHENSSPNNNLVNRHLILLFAIVLIGSVVYLTTQSPSSVLLSTSVLVIAHLAAIGLVFLFGRSLLASLINFVHGSPATTSSHSHAQDTHEHANLETTGELITWANSYDSFVQFILAGQEQKLREETIRLANFQSGEKVLDFGCGTGTLLITAKQKSDPSIEFTGIDAAPQMITRAKQKAAALGLNIHFETALAEAIPAPDNSYDIVMSSLVVHHLPPNLKDQVFAEVYRVLKPEGRLLVIEFEPPKSGFSKVFLRALLGDGMLSIDTSELPKLLEKAGFAEVKWGATSEKLATYASGKKLS